MSTAVSPPEYADFVERMKSTNAQLAEEFAGFHGIDHVLQWMQQHGLQQTEVDIVGQDEFNYDFLLRLGKTERWLGFGVS